jgi:hypothetical protein
VGSVTARTGAFPLGDFVLQEVVVLNDVPSGASSDGRHLRTRRPADLTSVAWLAVEDLAYDEWIRHGSRLGRASRSSGWWIGDWVRYGASRYGQKYAVATRVTGYDEQTLTNMVYVATRFEISRRRENLSWSHHAELSALSIDEQEHWLDRATDNRLSIRDLRRALIDARERAGDATDHTRAGRGAKPQMTAAPREDDDDHSAVKTRSARTSDVDGELLTCPRCGHRFDGGSVNNGLAHPI